MSSPDGHSHRLRAALPAALVLVLGASCSSPNTKNAAGVSQEPVVEPGSAQAAVTHVDEAVEVPAAPAAETVPQEETTEVWAGAGDLDGDGTEETLSYRRVENACSQQCDEPSCDGQGECEPDCYEVCSWDSFVVMVGDSPFELRFSALDIEKPEISIVDSAPKDSAKEVWIHGQEEGEDPPKVNIVLTFDGDTIRHFPISSSGGPADGGLSFKGGTIRVEDHLCAPKGRDEDRFEAFRRRRTFVVSDFRLSERSRRRKKVGGDEYDCYVACPFVYSRRGGTWVYEGEILRRLNTVALQGEQALSLRAPRGSQTVEVRISEEKPETTYLDFVAIEVGDATRLSPLSCNTLPQPNYCREDGRHEILSQGQDLVLGFGELPPGPYRLVADGYYLPQGESHGDG